MNRSETETAPTLNLHIRSKHPSLKVRWWLPNLWPASHFPGEPHNCLADASEAPPPGHPANTMWKKIHYFHLPSLSFAFSNICAYSQDYYLIISTERCHHRHIYHHQYIQWRTVLAGTLRMIFISHSCAKHLNAVPLTCPEQVLRQPSTKQTADTIKIIIIIILHILHVIFTYV